MDEKQRKILTLCHIHQHPRILLGMKKRGFGAGRWNGFGGKVNENEDIEDAARRELLEECGIEADYMEKQGILDFEFVENGQGNRDSSILEVHIFKVLEFLGEPLETEEMKPEWFYEDEMPFSQMWGADLHWLPLLIKGRKFRGRFLFDRPATAEYPGKIIERKLEIVPDLD